MPLTHVDLQCPAQGAHGGEPTYAVYSGQHRLGGVISNLPNVGFCKKFYDARGVQYPFRSNDDIVLPYYVLRKDTPAFVTDFLLNQLNTQPKSKASASGAWAFLRIYP